MFDSVKNELQRQDQFYISEIRPTVRQFIEGDNGCVIFFGPSGSGKSYTMQGKAGAHRGIIPRAVEEILTLISMDTSEIDCENGFLNLKTRESDYHDTVDKIYLRASVYMVHCENAYDLLSKGSAQSTRRVKVESYIDNKSNEVITQMVGLTKQIILNLEQYYNMMQEAFKERRILSSRLADHDVRKRSHFVVELSLVRKLKDSFEEISRVNFVELAGSEQSVSQPDTFIRDTSVRQFITKSFNSLSVQILKASTKKHGGGLSEEGESTLVNCLKATLSQNSNISVVSCCSPINSQFLHTLPAIKFCARIRDTIVRRMTRRNQGKKDTKETPRGFSECMNNLQQELQSIEQKLRIGDSAKTKDEAYAWCTRNLEFINKALYDCRKNGKSTIVDSLEYYKTRISEIENRYFGRQTKLDQLTFSEQRQTFSERRRSQEATPDRCDQIEDKEKVFNQVMRPHDRKSSLKISEAPKRDTSNEKNQYEDDPYEPVSYRSKKSDQTHTRIQSEVVSLPAHLKSLIEYKSTQKLSEMQEKFLSSQKIKDLIGGVNKPQQQLYESTEQTLQDIQRLILLEDFSGLKRRVVALSKERLSCNQVIDCQAIEIEELRMQLDARNDMVRGVTQLTESNIRECSEQIKQWEDQQQRQQDESSKQIAHLQFTLKNTTNQFEEMKKIKEEGEQRLVHALHDVDEHKKAKIIAETRLKEVSDQNEKIMLNYEVLKEHEMNMIKDCSNKQKESKQILAGKLSKLEQVISNKDFHAAELQQQIRDYDDQVRALKFEVQKRDEKEKIQSEHQSILECKIERQLRDADELQQAIAKLKREVQAKEETIRGLVSDRKEAMKEISDLQNLINSLENQCCLLNDEVKDRDKKLLTLMDAQREIADAKGVADECIRLKNKDLESVEIKLKGAQQELYKANEEYRQLEKANLRIKAQEYDKVDVMRRNIELEQTIKGLKQELEDVVAERNKSKKMGDARFEENQSLLEQNRKMAQEMESMKRAHEQTLNSFDKKFTDFSNELMILASQNQQMKEQEKTFKRRAHVMELENVEWREKCKYLEMRHYDATDRRDFRSIPEAPRLPTVAMSEMKQDLVQQEEAFGDIKSLINNFKREREQQKESKGYISNLQSSQRRLHLKSESGDNY